MDAGSPVYVSARPQEFLRVAIKPTLLARHNGFSAMLHRRTISNKPATGPDLHAPSSETLSSSKKAISNEAGVADHSLGLSAIAGIGITETPKRAPPLRRPSSGLYATPSSASRARYSVPSPSPSYLGLSVNPTGYPSSSSSPVHGSGKDGFDFNSVNRRSSSGYGYTSEYGQAGGNGYNLNHGMGFEEPNNATGINVAVWLNRSRKALERVKQGLSDAVRLDRSIGLVLGYVQADIHHQCSKGAS